MLRDALALLFNIAADLGYAFRGEVSDGDAEKFADKHVYEVAEFVDRG